MSGYANGELMRVNPTVLYLCDGKVPRCSGSFYCLTECKHTIDVQYAKNFEQFTTAHEKQYWEKDPEEESDGDQRIKA